MQKCCKRILAPFCILLAVSCSLLFLSFSYLSRALPDRLMCTDSADMTVAGVFPVKAVERSTDGRLQASLLGGEREYTAELLLFGLFPVGRAEVTVVSKSEVRVLGEPFGIKIYSDGAMVVGMSDVDTAEGSINPAKRAGVEIGDVLLSVGGRAVTENADVSAAVSESKGAALSLEISRGGKRLKLTVKPAYSVSEGSYRIGLWVRDSSAGIGTLTFYDPATGITAGLGHAITDRTTGEAVPLLSGEITGTEILGIEKSRNGAPGELRGRFVSSLSGEILLNSSLGIYGRVKSVYATDRLYPVATKQQVALGYAQLLSTVSDSGPELFDCTVERIRLSGSDQQSMVIRVTDERLLSIAGGIVQGMSGSPIIQNGRLIGAVTHVFVNDTQRGYAVFAENMLKTAQETARQEKREAS